MVCYTLRRAKEGTFFEDLAEGGVNSEDVLAWQSSFYQQAATTAEPPTFKVSALSALNAPRYVISRLLVIHVKRHLNGIDVFTHI